MKPKIKKTLWPLAKPKYALGPGCFVCELARSRNQQWSIWWRSPNCTHLRRTKRPPQLLIPFGPENKKPTTEGARIGVDGRTADHPGQNRSQQRLMVLEARFTSQLVHAEQWNNFCLMHYSSVVRREHSMEKAALVDILSWNPWQNMCICVNEWGTEFTLLHTIQIPHAPSFDVSNADFSPAAVVFELCATRCKSRVPAAAAGARKINKFKSENVCARVSSVW